MKRPLLLSLLALACATLGQAQEKKRPGPGERGGRVESDAGAAEAPDKPVDHALQRAAGPSCKLIPAMRPSRLAPGSSGHLVVTMALHDNAVLVSPPPVELTHQTRQGPLTLGTPSFRPATEARLAPAFRGQAVHDNWAVFDVPVSVDPGATHGKFPLWIGLTVQIHDGNTGVAGMRFTDRVMTQVEVGDPLPIFAAPGTSGRTAPAGPDPESPAATVSPSTPVATVTSTSPSPSPSPRDAARSADRPPLADEPRVGDAVGVPDAESEAGHALILLVVLAAMLGVLGLALALRRK